MDDKGRALLALARAAIASRLGLDGAKPETTSYMHEQAASFVTIHKHGALRGCIGTLEPYRPLAADVEGNAMAAAFEDPRFPPLTRQEFPLIAIELSVLSPLQVMPVRDEADALSRLRPGVDGVVLRFGMNRATFLPQVWEQLPDPAQFMAHLKMKAGLPATFWDPGIEICRYQVSKYYEQEKSRE
ncbi:MAG: AmmeMemoRadiSam system protein A [Zetaproteobacteria bacterium CG12_big_fil_rev_8_21_14_0_65_54_13]|nr:MAG: AMMECR1 domain-containing protein [Zetaproteobacteria bacterium CG23_combo_of_CG06-09_8_20_14_all_54_7]PIW50598.1 MAG: AmmeMemoRadiSam system protein A [Zetaproteobacteria bacterium CG12_big_fil_rev_8_21_14_0_65_54_13]PIX54436.1 MAG: AmmeMemoRadiSam system protein A [Zetaproteobacteria bacterium CG_4_10_14_3_um_filter_54_28]PJA28836.1 MAG: AmmeMemoRadiSam system protein A [Zetaproteobacteria bacterium CG_4_9_14_3_um_filter_54_145]